MRIDPFNFSDISGQKLVPIFMEMYSQIEEGSLRLNEAPKLISKYNLNPSEVERLLLNLAYPSIRKTEGLGFLSALNRNIGEFYAKFDGIKYEQSEISAYENAIAIDSNNAEAFFNRGVAFLEKSHIVKKEGDITKFGNYINQAMASFVNAINLNPGYAEAYFQLGTIYEELRNYDYAIQMYEQAAIFNPFHFRALFNLGVVNAKQQGSADNPKTIEVWAKAVFIDQGRNNLINLIPENVKSKVAALINDFITKSGRQVSLYRHSIIGSAL
jgi:tetratricopeptide (TPR) repeat protein